MEGMSGLSCNAKESKNKERKKESVHFQEGKENKLHTNYWSHPINKERKRH